MGSIPRSVSTFSTMRKHSHANSNSKQMYLNNYAVCFPGLSNTLAWRMVCWHQLDYTFSMSYESDFKVVISSESFRADFRTFKQT